MGNVTLVCNETKEDLLVIYVPHYPGHVEQRAELMADRGVRFATKSKGPCEIKVYKPGDKSGDCLCSAENRNVRCYFIISKDKSGDVVINTGNRHVTLPRKWKVYFRRSKD